MKLSFRSWISQNLDVLWYSLPMLLTGIIALLTFYPGILTEDSGSHIRDAIFNTNTIPSPPLYTWMIRILIDIIPRPAVIGLFQIGCLAISFGWGMSILKRRGLPSSICLAISILFAVYPINLLYPITVWRDIPYSIALLIMTIMVYQILFSEKEWLNQPLRWLGLGVVALSASLLRSNGLPVSILFMMSLFLFIIIKKKSQLRKFIYSLGVFILGYLIIVFAIYPVIGFQEDHPYRYLFIHHIAAHVANKTPQLDAGERKLLDSLYPLDQWKYNCYSDSTTLYVNGFNLALFKEQEKQLASIFFDLLRRDPGVEVRHMICSSAQVWAFNIPMYIFSIEPVGGHGALAYHYISENSKNISELLIFQDPIFPDFQTPLYKYGKATDLVWTPALYSYLSIVFLVLMSVFNKSWRYFILSVPVAFNSFELAIVGYSTEFRYQYMNLLVAFFLFAVLLLALINKIKIQSRGR